MSKKLETLFSERVKRDLDAIPDLFQFKLMAGSIRGIPDRVGCRNGRFIALELKTDVGKTDPLQEWTLGKLKRAGAYVAIATPANWPIILREIKTL